MVPLLRMLNRSFGHLKFEFCSLSVAAASTISSALRIVEGEQQGINFAFTQGRLPFHIGMAIARHPFADRSHTGWLRDKPIFDATIAGLRAAAPLFATALSNLFFP
jgi:hypothetical protein